MRELTVTVLILDDATCWIRQGGVMRQVPSLTYEELEEAKPTAKRRKMGQLRTKRAKKSGGGPTRPQVQTSSRRDRR